MMAPANRVLIVGGALLAGIATVVLALLFGAFLTPLLLRISPKPALIVPLVVLLIIRGPYLRRMQAKKKPRPVH